MGFPFSPHGTSSQTPGRAAPALPFGPPAAPTNRRNPFSATRLSEAGISQFDDIAKQEREGEDAFYRTQARQQSAAAQQQKLIQDANAEQEKQRQKALELDVTRASLQLAKAPETMTRTQREALEKKQLEEEAKVNRSAAATVAAATRESPAFNERTDKSWLPFGMGEEPTPAAKELQDRAAAMEAPGYTPSASDLDQYRKINPTAFSELDSFKSTLESDKVASEQRTAAELAVARAKAIKDGLSPEEVDSLLGKPAASSAVEADTLDIDTRKASMARIESEVNSLATRESELTAEMQKGATSTRFDEIKQELATVSQQRTAKAAELTSQQKQVQDSAAALETKKKAQVEQSLSGQNPAILDTALKTAKVLADGSFETSQPENIEALAKAGKKVFYSDGKQDTKPPTDDIRQQKKALTESKIKDITETAASLRSGSLKISENIQARVNRGDITKEQGDAEWDSEIEDYSKQNEAKQAELGQHLNDAVMDFKEGVIDASTLNAIYHAAGQPETGVEAFKEHKAKIDAEDAHVAEVQKVLNADTSGELVGKSSELVNVKGTSYGRQLFYDLATLVTPGLNPGEIKGGGFLGPEAYAQAQAGKVAQITTEIDKLRAEKHAKMSEVLTKRGVDEADQARIIARAELEGMDEAPRIGFGEAIEAQGGGVKGVTAGISEKLPFVGGLVKAGKVLPYAELANRLEAGEKLEPGELDALTEFVRYSQREGSVLLKITEGVSDSLSFGAEMAMTGGTGAAVKKGVMQTVRGAITWASAKESIAKLAKAKAETLLAGKITGGVVAKAIAAKTLKAIPQTAVFVAGTGANKTLAAYVDDQATQGIGVTEQEGKIVAALDRTGALTGEARHSQGRMMVDALFGQAKEFTTEKVGAAMPLLGKVLGKAAPKTAAAWQSLTAGAKAKISGLAMVRALQKLNPAKQTGDIGRFLRAAGQQGLGMEILEERVGDVADAAYGWFQDGKFDLKLPTAENFAVEVASMMIPMGAGAVQSVRAQKRIDKAITDSDAQSSAEITNLFARPEETAQMLSAGSGQQFTADDVTELRNLTGPIETSDAVRKSDERHIALLAKASQAEDEGDPQRAYRFKQMALEESRNKGALAIQHLAKAADLNLQIKDALQQADEIEAAPAADAKAKKEAKTQALEVRESVDLARAVVKIGRGLEAELTKAETTILKKEKAYENGVISQTAIDKAAKLVPGVKSFVRPEQEFIQKKLSAAAGSSPTPAGNVAPQVGGSSAAAASPSPSAAPAATAPAQPAATGATQTPANAPTGTTGGKFWRVTGSDDTVVDIPRDMASSAADAKRIAVGKSTDPRYRLPGLERPTEVQEIDKSEPTSVKLDDDRSNARPVSGFQSVSTPTGTSDEGPFPKMDDAKKGGEISDGDMVTQEREVQPGDLQKMQNRKAFIAEKLNEALKNVGAAFTGITFNKSGKRGAVEPESESVNFDLDAIDLQTLEITDPAALQLEIEKVVEEEVHHVETVKLLKRRAKKLGKKHDDLAAESWNDVTPELRKRVELLYNYGKSFPAGMPDSSKGYELYRFYTQMAKSGQITEGANFPESIKGLSKKAYNELVGFLRDLGTWMIEQLPKMPPAKRKQFKKDVAAVVKAVKALENYAKKSKPAKGAPDGGLVSGSGASTGTTDAGASPPSSAAPADKAQTTKKASSQTDAERVGQTMSIKQADEILLAPKIAEALAQGEPLGWGIDGSGRITAGIGINEERQIQIDPTPTERKLIQRAKQLDDLAETPAELAEAKKAMQDALLAPTQRKIAQLTGVGQPMSAPQQEATPQPAPAAQSFTVPVTITDKTGGTRIWSIPVQAETAEQAAQMALQKPQVRTMVKAGATAQVGDIGQPVKDASTGTTDAGASPPSSAAPADKAQTTIKASSQTDAERLLGPVSDVARSLMVDGWEFAQNDTRDGSFYLKKGGKFKHYNADGSPFDEAAEKPASAPKSSTQFTLSAADAKPILDFGKSIPKDELFESVDPEWSNGALEDEPHVTVLYGLTKHEAAPVAKAIKDHGPVTVTLGKLSIFENGEYDVLKIDVEGPELRSLNAKLSKLPNENSFPDYRPHMTIAYLKKGEGKKYVGDTRFEGQTITFDTMTFSPPSELRGELGKPELPLAKVEAKKETTPTLPTPDKQVPPETAQSTEPSREEWQKTYAKFKRALAKAVKAKDYAEIIRQADAFQAHYEADGNGPFPDTWSDWERHKSEAEMQLARQGSATNPLVVPILKPVTPPRPAASEDADYLKAQEDTRAALGGLFSAPVRRSIPQLEVPEERFDAVRTAAKSIIAAKIRTPEAFAKFLDDTFPGGKARPYSEAIWDVMGVWDKSLRGTHDWSRIYGDIDQPLPEVQEPVSPEATISPEAKSEQGAAPASYLERVLDAAIKDGMGELTIPVPEKNQNRDDLQKAIEAIQARGLQASTDGKNILVRGFRELAPASAKEQDEQDESPFMRERNATIKASKEAGNVHLDAEKRYVENSRGREIYNVHDPKERGIIRTVSNQGEVVVHWSDKYSGEKNLATAKTEQRGRKKVDVLESWLMPTDLVDYVFADSSKPAPQAKADTPASGLITDEESARLDALTVNNKDRLDKLSGNQLSQLNKELLRQPSSAKRDAILATEHPDDIKAALDVVAPNKATTTEVNLVNLYKVDDATIKAAASQEIAARQKYAAENPDFGKYRPSAAAKRYNADPSRVNAIAVVLESLKAQAALKVPVGVSVASAQKADTPATAEAKVEEQVQTVAATEGQRDAKEIKKEIATKIEKAIKDLETGQSQENVITFQIPGDGTFKVLNQLISLQAVLKRVKRISTTDNSAPEKVKEPKQETTDYALEWGTEASFNTALDQLQEFVAANVEELQKNPNTIVPIERLTRYQGGRSRYTASQKANTSYQPSLAAAVTAWQSTQGSKMPTWAELRDWLGYRARQAGQSAGIEWTPESPAEPAQEPTPSEEAPESPEIAAASVSPADLIRQHLDADDAASALAVFDGMTKDEINNTARAVFGRGFYNNTKAEMLTALKQWLPDSTKSVMTALAKQSAIASAKRALKTAKENQDRHAEGILGMPTTEQAFQSVSVAEGKDPHSILYSATRPTSASDAEYLAAVEAGDMDKAQRMVDEAAKAAGYATKDFWRAVKRDGARGELQSRENSYVTDDVDAARDYKQGLNYALQRVYIKKGKRLNVNSIQELQEILPNEEFNEDGYLFEELDRQSIRDAIWELGYDMVKFPDVSIDNSREHDAWLIKSQGSIKSGMPITRDDQGNIIPLSQRFNPESNSILYSATRPARLGIDDDVVADALDELDALPEADRERVNKIAGYDLITNEEQAAQAAAIKQEGTSQFYDETRDRENHRAWSKWANDAYNADPEGSIRKIVLEARNGFTGHSGQQAKLAMLVLEKLSRKAAFTGDAQMLRDVEAVTLAFDLRSTLAGREIAARWQPHATMEEQHRTTIAKAIFGPTGETRRKLDEAMSRASKNERIRELEAQVTKLLADLKARQAKPMKPAEKTTFVTDKKTLDKLRKDLERVKLAKTEAELLAEQNQTRLDEVREMFEESGFTMEEVMIDEAARLKLQSSPMVKKVLESFNPMERVAIRAIIEGKSDRAASIESKISRDNIRKVEARFDEALNNELDSWIDRGFTPDDMDRPDFASFMDKKGKLFASIRPQPGGITMAQRQKLRQSWRNAIHPPARVRNNTARKRIKSKKGKGTGLRIRNPQHAITVMRVLQREDTSGFDRVYEYWINGILSGIGTHTANVAGNMANVMLEYGLQRWVEAGANMIIGDAKGATAGELITMSKWVAGAAVTAFKQAKEAWNYEVSSFDWDAMGTHPKLDSLSVDGKTGFIHRLAIAGTKGRIIRIPSRALLFMDEFTKYFVGTIEAAAQGHRIAKAEKLTGAAFDDRVNELVRIPGSPAWVLALEKAQEMTFQQDLPKMLADAQKLLNAKSKSKLGATVRFALKMIFPFIKTPYNILAAGLRKSPLGSVRLAGKAVTGGYKGKGAELSHDLAEQVIAAFVMMLVSGMAEGDPDDDKKPILITGTRGRDDRSEANFLNRSKGGETTVLFYGKPVFHYGRFAPLAVTVATIVNSLREMKKIPNGKDKIAVASSIFGDFVNTARSQTFLAGFDGLVNFVNSLSRESEGTEVQKAVKFLMNGAIPNIVRQTTRNLDEQVRDSKNAPWYYHAVPYGDLAEPLYDLYGRPAMKGGTALSRLFVTEPARVESVAPADVLLGRWNQLNPVQKEGDGSSYFPSDLTKASFKFKDLSGKYQDMTPAEIREFRKRVGVEISTQSAGLSTVPIQENIDELKKIRGSAAEKVKKEMFGGGVRPVLKSAPSLSQLLLGK